MAKNATYVSILNFLCCLGDYIALPILALLFNSHLTLFEVGVLMGAPTLVSTFLGFASHVLDKRFANSTMLISSAIVSIMCYLVFLFCDNFFILLLFALLRGFARILWIPVTKKLFSLTSKELNNSEFAFRLRYCTICLASILGPMMCAFLVSCFSNEAALMAAIGLFAVLSVCIVRFKEKIDIRESVAQKAPGKRRYSISYLFSVLKSHRVLCMYIAGGATVYFVFSQFEATFSLFLKVYFENPGTVFSYLLTLNAVLCLIFQYIFIRFPFPFSNLVNLGIGNFCFSIAFILFAISNGSWVALILAVVIYSAGEILTIPAIDIAIDNISTPENKTLYFGLSEFRTVGFTLGPIFAGFMLEYTSPFWMCAAFACIIFFSTAWFFPKEKLSTVES